MPSWRQYCFPCCLTRQFRLGRVYHGSSSAVERDQWVTMQVHHPEAQFAADPKPRMQSAQNRRPHVNLVAEWRSIFRIRSGVTIGNQQPVGTSVIQPVPRLSGRHRSIGGARVNDRQSMRPRFRVRATRAQAPICATLSTAGHPNRCSISRRIFTASWVASISTSLHVTG